MILSLTYRYWEAVKHWDEAIQLTPTSAILHEMISQACVDCLHMLMLYTLASIRTVDLMNWFNNCKMWVATRDESRNNLRRGVEVFLYCRVNIDFL